MANVPSEEKRYDYIVVGAGAAGSVFAAELVASGAQVLVIESGVPDDAPTILNRRERSQRLGRVSSSWIKISSTARNSVTARLPIMP